MLGILFTIIGGFVIMLGLSFDGFENQVNARNVRRMFVLSGMFLFFIGLLLAAITL